jgi:hypothetical protein
MSNNKYERYGNQDDAYMVSVVCLRQSLHNEHIALCRIAELELEVKRLQSVVDMLTGDLAS